MSDPDRPPAGRLQARSVVVVALGGAVGTAVREALSLAIPDLGRFPLAVLIVNVSGALLLGVLLEALGRRGPDTGSIRLVRLAAGTGFCGGFTTYSTLAVGAATLLADGAAPVAIGYLLATLLLGAAATGAGIALGSVLGAGREAA